MKYIVIKPALRLLLLCSVMAMTPDLNQNLQAQKTTYLSLEAGPSWKMIKEISPGNYFTDVAAPSYTSGINLRQEVLDDLFLSLGFYYSPNHDGFNMDDKRPHNAIWKNGFDLGIPLTIGYRLEIPNLLLSFTPYVGYSMLLENQYGQDPEQQGQITTATGERMLFRVEAVDESDLLGQLEMGLGVNFRPVGLWQISMNLGYRVAAFSESRTRHLVHYQEAGASEETATYSDKGNALSLTLALDVPLSNLWNNKDYRIRKRIEQGRYEGKAVDSKGSYYIGTELGFLHRAIISSSPIVGPRPMDGRGFLGYSNFHGGLYGGYMFTGQLGADVGVYYQRSSTIFSVMSDHEVDLAHKSADPMLLEVPFRFRYFYDLYKQKLHLVVYGGPSLLISFGKGAGSSGSGLNFEYDDLTTGAATPATAAYTSSRNSIVAPVLRLGTGLEYRLPIDFPLIATGYFNYHEGFAVIDQTQVQLTGLPAGHIANMNYRGSGWSLEFGVKMPLKSTSRDCSSLRPERTN